MIRYDCVPKAGGTHECEENKKRKLFFKEL